jgi:gamma-glutamylcyclotransferase (GGCT)/AIG2-like uncharacterized protein YtfP
MFKELGCTPIKMTTTNTEHVFAYGTLRPPRSDTPADDSRYYFRLLSHIQLITPAYLLNGDLYDLDTYPGARPGEGTIQGDLLTVNPAALPIMDRIEGHPIFFKRARVTVQTESDPVEAWIYWAPPGMVVGRRRITNGDWLLRHQAPPTDDITIPDQTQLDETLRALVARFAQANCSWLSSVRPDGRAHSAPVWHVWYQGRIYIGTISGAVKTANILENPSVVITHPDPVDALIIEGWATPAAKLEAQLQPLFKAKYNWDISSDAEYDTIIEITPTKLLAWGKHGQGRWPGSEVLQVWSV